MVVRMRRNRSQTAKRRSHAGIGATRVSKCECGAERQSHRACPECGRYNGRVVIDIVARQKKEARRAKRRAEDGQLAGQSTASKSEPKKKEDSSKSAKTQDKKTAKSA